MAALCATLFSVAFLGSAASLAHPISVTDALVRVSQNQADVQITVFLEDLYLFHDLEPNDKDFLELNSIARGAELHKKFLMERFVIRDAQGDRIAAEFVSIDKPKLPPAGVPLAELMSYKLSYQFRYAMQNAPEFLTISQHLVDEDLSIPAETRLVIQQANSGVAFTAALTTEEPQTVRFDWKGKPLAEKPSAEELQAWFEEQRKQTLGITSYSSIYSFLYIEDQEIRHEILMPLLTLSKSIPLTRKDEAFLEISEQDSAQQAIEEFFTKGNPIVADGETLSGKIVRLNFFGVEEKDFAKPTERSRVSMASARVGVILSYPTFQPPRKVSLTWDRFNPVIYTVRLTAFTAERAEKKTLSKIGGRNTYEWAAEGRVKQPFAAKVLPVTLEPRAIWTLPIASMLIAMCAIFFAARARRRRWIIFVFILIAFACWPVFQIRLSNPLQGQPKLPATDAQDVIVGLLNNAYGALSLRDENESYDALAVSVDGPLLGQLYLQIRRGMVLEQQGGAVARIRQIDALEGRLEPLEKPADDERAFRYRLAWTVRGDVEHWGHIHSRTNRYDALFTIEPRDAHWRLTGLELLEEKRVKSQTDVRELGAAKASAVSLRNDGGGNREVLVERNSRQGTNDR